VIEIKLFKVADRATQAMLLLHFRSPPIIAADVEAVAQLRVIEHTQIELGRWDCNCSRVHQFFHLRKLHQLYGVDFRTLIPSSYLVSKPDRFRLLIYFWSGELLSFEKF